eukprot:scaffold144509_cov25-Prasinocladus_malaysianus.AAC.1
MFSKLGALILTYLVRLGVETPKVAQLVGGGDRAPCNFDHRGGVHVAAIAACVFRIVALAGATQRRLLPDARHLKPQLRRRAKRA